MSNKHPLYREGRIGGFAGEGIPVCEIIKVAIDNATRADHGIDTAAVKYGEAAPIHLHQGQVPQADLDAGLRGHPPNLDRHKDER